MTETTPVQHAHAAFITGWSSDFLLQRLQRKLLEWQLENFKAGSEWPASLHLFALGVAEEAGELAHAVLKRAQYIRGMQDEAAFLEAAGDAIADCAIFCIQACSALGLDFSTLLYLTAEEVMNRTAESLKKP